MQTFLLLCLRGSSYNTYMATHFTNATCPECNTYFSRVPVEGDGIDLYAVLEIEICIECGTSLCQCCDRAKCASCNQTVCAEHLTLVDDLKCCSECAFDISSQEPELPARIQPQTETETPALACPACLGTDLRCETWAFGRDGETGYQDAGESFVCRSCGTAGEAGELVELPAVVGKPMGAAASAARSVAGSSEVA